MGGSSMTTRTITEKRAAEKAAVSVDNDAYWQVALTADPDKVRAWLASPASAGMHVLGPWIGSLVEGEPERAVIVVRSRTQFSPPEGFALFDPDAAAGLVGVFMA
jgi:hypothetical protein